MSEDEHTDASPPDDEAGDDGDGERPGSEPEREADEAGAASEAGEDEAAALRAELEALRDELEEMEGDVETEFEELEAQVEEFEDDIEDRTVHREAVERDLKRYVRKRVRRGHARGWGPYLVLLYGTAMTIGAFYFLQDSAGFAILAMIVIWLSTLGLFALMLIVGVVFNVLSLPGRARDALGALRDRS
jgi:hypothetical protein